MHTKNIITAGGDLDQAQKVLILIHGRGGTARDILNLANYFPVKDFALLAPEATNNTWYPYSFMAPTKENEPWLSSALGVLLDLLEEIKSKGISSQDIYIGGFSQGACLAAEFITRNADRYGGAFLFTGGLIGDQINKENYKGDFSGTPVFIGTGNPDSHVPLERVLETQKIMESMNAKVEVQVYEGRPHTISHDEIQKSKDLIFSRSDQ